jgi:hypothetical protein
LEFRQGSAPETILQDFPAIASLENVYGTITDYLANPPKVEEYLKAQEQKWGEFRKSADPLPASFKRIRVHHQGHSVLVRRLAHFRDQRWSDHRQSALRTGPRPKYVFTQIPPDALTAATVAAGVCVASSAPWERWMGVRDRSFA